MVRQRVRHVTTLATLGAPSGDTCAYTNDWALVGIKRWYRAKVGETASAAVAFTRFRRLERDPRNSRSCLNPGVSIAKGDYHAFDGKDEHWSDVASTYILNLGTPHYVVACRFLPRPTCCTRIGNRYWYGAKTTAEYDSGTYTQLGFVAKEQTAHVFCWSASPDVENTYQYLKIDADYGNLNEFEAYGWSTDDLAAPAGTLIFDVENYSNCCPVITWMYPKGATNVQLQVSRAADHGFTTLASIDNPSSPSAVFTNTTGKVGVKRYYRVIAVADGVTTASAAVGHTRFRRIDRTPGQENVRFAKYTYSATMFFDGKLNEDRDGGAAPGIIFNERLWVAGVRTYPRPNWASRVEGKTFYGYLTQADSAAGIAQVLNYPVLGDDGQWNWTCSRDVENPYYRVTVPTLCNSLSELQVFGWDEADIVAAAESVMPKTFVASSDPDVSGGAILTWSGQQHIAKFNVQYRVLGASAWVSYGSDVAGEATTCKVSGLTNGTQYEFRLVGTGDDAWVDYTPEAGVLIYQLEPSDGTGLNALLAGNCTLDTRITGRPFFEHRIFQTLNVVQTNSLFAQEAHTNAIHTLVCFRGQIEIPVDGDYTFRVYVDGNDGVSICLDGAQLWNKLPTGGTGTGIKTLTKGKHAFEIDWMNVETTQRCQLTWACDGVFGETVVPKSQLFPAADADLPAYEHAGFDFLVPSQGGLGIPRMQNLGGGYYRFYRTTGSENYDRRAVTSFTTLLSGEGAVEFTVQSSSMDTVAFVASPNTPDNQFLQCGAYGYVRVKGSQYKGHYGSSGDLGPTHNGFSGVNFGFPYKMRIERKPKDTITFKVRGAKPDASRDWVVIKTMKTTESGHGYYNYDTLRFGWTSAYAGTFDVTISNLRVLQPGTLLRLR